MKIDNRTAQDIEQNIEELAKSYIPEWHFDLQDPDIGSAIAKIFANSMKENVDLENRILDRYHAEFINMLDLSLKPAKPAGSMVKIDLIEDTITGTHVRRGTRLVTGETTGGSQIVFETDREIYVTNSRLTDAFMTDRENASFVPLLGEFRQALFVDGVAETVEDEESEEEGAEEDNPEIIRSGAGGRIRPFVLFSEEGNIARSALVMYHESLFDIVGEPIYVRLSGNSKLMKEIENGEYLFSYYTKKGYVPFESVKLLEDHETLELIKQGENRHLIIGGRSYAVIVMEAKHTISEDRELTGVGLSSSGKERDAEFVSDGSSDMDVTRFTPFSDTLSVYNECYIGQDLYFREAGSRITVSFHTEYKDRGLYLTKQEEESVLKVVKKKPRVEPGDVPADAYADEICFEYFNGQGWKKLNLETDCAQIFSKALAGDTEFSFICPEDWEETQVGAFTGRTIRIRLLKSDNCYLRPGMHHYPVVEDLKISFSYEGHFVDPEKLSRISGTEKKEITGLLKKKQPFVAISGGAYPDDALYLGFNRRMDNGPVSIYFELEDVQNMSALKCSYEYSSANGFRHMKVVDNTKDFSRSGTVVFMPPSDMAETELEGRRRFWIRIRRERISGEEETSLFLPHIQDILINVVNVSNIMSGQEENHYISEAAPNQRISLHSGNILDAEVWVNERDVISADETDRLKRDDPDRIRVELDRLGNISAVYVRWNETDSFLGVSDRRSYMIDRLTGELVFSDGIKADYPRVTDDISIKVRVRTTDGEAGNVEAYAINQTAGTRLYINSVYNPVRSYGGSNMETTAEALRRGANLLYGRGRLVSTADYIFTILSFSRSIDKAACIPGERVDGVADPADISFVLLMKDFEEGSFSFHRIAAPLKKHLLEGSSMTVSEEHMFIVEPIFVTISVNVWAEVPDMDLSFETQSLIEKTLEEYLRPVSSDSDDGWDIGVVPKKSQIQMKLGALRSRAMIRNISIIARYVDRLGEHEMDIADLEASPFMVVRSGEHKINIALGATGRDGRK
ncbi:MAG: hypothetical protein K6E90_08885 [Lachnospiraceae bacterium]|nr:hypothetical protein [Lachnospiraceae bacterium]